jgi:hypothetical protein
MLALWKYEKYLEMIRIVYLIVVGVFGVGAIISRTHNFAGRILRNFAT